MPSTATVVTMELEESALPLHTDATMKLRPRLFLEGNLFVDLQPGSPNAPEADDGHIFPAGQTAVAVQLDQVLTTLQSDVRTNLQVLLDQFGNALDKYGGSEGLRELFRSSPGAFRYTSQVNEALLGQEAHDLSDLIVNLDSTVEALGRNEGALQDLVTNLRIVLGSFAAESDALERGIAELPRVLEEGGPALASLNRAFPAVRAFAREALPGVRSTPATLDAATPFLRQLRGLVSENELRGLVADLRPAIPDLAPLTRRTIPLLNEFRPLASCVNEVLVPWSQDDGPRREQPDDQRRRLDRAALRGDRLRVRGAVRVLALGRCERPLRPRARHERPEHREHRRNRQAREHGGAAPRRPADARLVREGAVPPGRRLRDTGSAEPLLRPSRPHAGSRQCGQRHARPVVYARDGGARRGDRRRRSGGRSGSAEAAIASGRARARTCSRRAWPRSARRCSRHSQEVRADDDRDSQEPARLHRGRRPRS